MADKNFNEPVSTPKSKSAIYPSQCNRKKKGTDCILWPVLAFGWAPVTMFGHEAIHINLSFTRSRKSKDVEIVEAEI